MAAIAGDVRIASQVAALAAPARAGVVPAACDGHGLARINADDAIEVPASYQRAQDGTQGVNRKLVKAAEVEDVGAMKVSQAFVESLVERIGARVAILLIGGGVVNRFRELIVGENC